MKRIKHITPARIMSWGPCSYWPREHVKAAFGGRRSLTPLEIADLSDVPVDDRLWVVLREGVIPARELRLIACWCADRALRRERAAGREPDKRSWEAVRVARRFAEEKATVEELAAAWDAAGAAGAAAWDAAWAARAAAGAARDAAGAARVAEYKVILTHVRRVLRNLEEAEA